MISAAQSHPHVPAWITDALEISTNRGPNTEPVVEYDTEEAIIRATDHLRNHAPLAVEGDHGDATTNRVMARVKDYGVSPEMCLAIALEEWNPRCSPPWSPEALAYKIDSAWRSGKNPPGSAHSSVAFDRMPREPIAKGKFIALLPDGIVLDTEPRHLIEGVIDEKSTAVIYGASNSGKTFFTMDLAGHIAAGKPWGGREVKQGLVVYIAAEAGHGAKRRVLALKRRLGAEEFPLALVPHPVNLRSNLVDANELVDLVRAVEADVGQPCVLVVIDTLSRALSGGDENASSDMGEFIRHVEHLRARVDATVLLVHHSGKNAAAGARGWSGLKGALDTEIEVKELPGGERVASFEKQREGEKASPVRFALRTVVLGADTRGKDIKTCVVALEGEHGFTVAAVPPRQALDKAHSSWHTALMRASEDPRAVDGRVSTQLWAAYHYGSGEEPPEDVPSLRTRGEKERRIFGRARAALVQAGWAISWGGSRGGSWSPIKVDE